MIAGMMRGPVCAATRLDSNQYSLLNTVNVGGGPFMEAFMSPSRRAKSCLSCSLVDLGVSAKATEARRSTPQAEWRMKLPKFIRRARMLTATARAAKDFARRERWFRRAAMNPIRPLTHADLLQLKRWNTPTIYNGWEQITKRNAGGDAVNLEEVRDFMPQMGPMVGYAVTVVIEPGNPAHRAANPTAGAEYRRYVAGVPGPKIVVVQDLEKPRTIGAFWGEVN